MLDARFSHLYFCQSLNRLQRGLSAIAELLVQDGDHKIGNVLLVAGLVTVSVEEVGNLSACQILMRYLNPRLI